MSLKNTAETLAQVTIPVPVSISGLTWLGITMKDWVLTGTAVLIVFQLIVIAPKAYRVLQQGKIITILKIKGAFNHYGQGNQRSP
jgi:hypothetical protein